MALLNRKPYSRRDSLTAADTFLKKGKSKKAIREYEKVLDEDGEDPIVLKRLAESYLAAKRPDDARAKFLEAASAYEAGGFREKALAIYLMCRAHFPKDRAVWMGSAELQVLLGRKKDAVKSLLDASRQFRSKHYREDQFDVLVRATEIEPFHFDATLSLGGLLAKSGQKSRAQELLRGLAERNSGAALRRVRGRLFRLSPTPSALFAWLRALLLGR